MKEESVKLTFIGDLTVDRPLLSYSHLGNNQFDFNRVFSRLRNRFADSDYVVGNFETVCAGSKDYFRTEYMLLNSPDEFIDAIKNANIDMVTTANNHCLDQNIKGLERTLNLLDKLGIEHTGTYRTPEEFQQIFVKEINGLRLAFIAGTYGTNESNIDYRFHNETSYYVDLLRSQEIKFPKSFSGLVKKAITKIFPGSIIRRVRRFLARRKISRTGSFFSVYIDKIKDGDFNNPYLESWLGKIEQAKKLADYVFVLPHMGGQFNEEPGPYSQALMEKLLAKEVHVIANHPHVIQKILIFGDYLGVFSVGGFNMSISGDYILHNLLPQYSLAIHYYFNGKQLDKISYSLLKIIEDNAGGMEVYPIDLLENKLDAEERKVLLDDVRCLHRRIGTNYDSIEKEYLII